VPRYAENTQVSSDRSRAEIERILFRYGADKFAYATERARAQIAFEIGGRRIVFRLPLPDRDADEFRLTPSKKWERSEEEQAKAYEQAVRQRWRALALVIKAKLEAVDAGITTIEDEFLAHIAIPGAGTVGDWLKPRLDEVYRGRELPALMPGGTDG
jgi:hypothetical protein